jgi:hypothetical protein
VYAPAERADEYTHPISSLPIYVVCDIIFFYFSFPSSKWKNERPVKNEAYSPTMKEHVANILTHGVSNYCSALINSRVADPHSFGPDPDPAF